MGILSPPDEEYDKRVGMSYQITIKVSYFESKSQFRT